MIPSISFTKPSIDALEKMAVLDVLDSGWLAQGKQVELFEKEFAEYVGVKYAVFTNSCTSALKMAYKMLKETGVHGIQYPKNTYSATYAVAVEMGLEIKAKEDVTEYPLGMTIATVNVHYGSIKNKKECTVEDSAHRIERKDPLVGAIRCYSFHPTKNMTTGLGGMFVTNDKEIYEKARLWQRDGLTTSAIERRSRGSYLYDVVAMAGGYESGDINAAIGRVQLKKLPAFTKKRNDICKQYNNAFGLNWAGNHLYPYFVSSEKEVGELIKFMKDNGVQCGYHYPNTGWLGVSLPLYPDLKDKEVGYIIEKVLDWKRQCK